MLVQIQKRKAMEKIMLQGTILPILIACFNFFWKVYLGTTNAHFNEKKRLCLERRQLKISLPRPTFFFQMNCGEFYFIFKTMRCGRSWNNSSILLCSITKTTKELPLALLVCSITSAIIANGYVLNYWDFKFMQATGSLMQNYNWGCFVFENSWTYIFQLEIHCKNFSNTNKHH